MSENKYSVIITAFNGKWTNLHEAVSMIFGRGGLDISTIIIRHGGMPSELVANKPLEEAERIAKELEPLGATVKIMPSSEVHGVVHRAEELWSTRSGESFRFSEVDGMITTLPLLNAKENLEHMRTGKDTQEDWRSESFMNHTHIGLCETSREAIREGLDFVKRLKHDLETVYPEKRFVIVNTWDDTVTFYQASDGAPTGSTEPEDRNPEQVWCKQCEKMRPYRKRTDPDPEFPEADWGDCDVCGGEVLVYAPESYTIVEPA